MVETKMKILNNDSEVIIVENVKTADDWAKIEAMVEELSILINDRYIKNIKQFQSAKLNGK
jgi:hypothetical protein